MFLSVEDFGRDYILTLRGPISHRVKLGKPFLREDEPKEKSSRLAELDVLLNIDGSHSQGEQAITKSARPSVLENLKRSLPPRKTASDKPKRPHQEH